MANEESAVGNSAVAPAPVATPAPSADEEKVRMAEELRQARAALGEVGEMVKSGKLRLHEEAPAEPKEEDESALIDRKELKKFAAGLNQQVAQAFQQTAAVNAARLRDANIELLRGKLKNFDKYEAEIKGLLEKVDPNIAANPDTIKQVHRIVAANHQKEEIDAAVAEALAAHPRAELEDDGWGESEEEVTEEVAPQVGRAQSAKPIARTGGVAPSGDASATRPVLRSRQANVAPLSREEKAFAQVFGIKSAAEYRQYADKNWEPDTQGARGRNRF